MEEGAGLEDVAGKVILHQVSSTLHLIPTKVLLDKAGYIGNVSVQATNSSPVTVSGEVAGLPEGAFVLRLVEAGCGAGCQGGNCGPQLWVWDQVTQ